MTRIGTTLTLLIGASLGLSACSDSIDEPKNDGTGEPGPTTGDVDTTFDHDNDGITPFELIERTRVEGAPSFTTHVHSCSKVRYANLGTLLTDLGVNVNNTAALSAGALYKSAASAMGIASYANRVRENIALTTSGASALFDVFVAAAPEVITALQNNTLARCPGVGAMFDAGGKCNQEAITCLIGQPAQPGHVDVCNKSVTSASDATTGQRIAVAALLAAAYTCE